MRRFALAVLPMAGLAAAATYAAKPYAIPPDRAPATLPSGSGAELTANTCAACHSLDYLTNQPRGKGAQFWKDSVAKMVNVYGAKVEKPDADIIADYLGKTFG
jgi:mono/diheme cytochrome c family protein